MIILGLETSCDETSAALLEIKQGKFKLLSHVVSSSVKEQAKYGGVVPEVAARKQMEYIIPVLQETLGNPKHEARSTRQIQNSNTKNSKSFGFRNSDFGFVTAVAVTVGPGLATSLQVGIDAAKTLAYSWAAPLIPVNHLEGHLFSPLLPAKESKNLKFKIKNSIKLPAVALIVSGGHTELILVKDYLKYKLLGRTRDDAAGEAFDKVAKLLGLGYPGGPIISKLAKDGDEQAFDFPRGMIDSGDYDFSFSGLKTAVLYSLLNKGGGSTPGASRRTGGSKRRVRKVSGQELNNLAASFQRAAIDVLVAKTMRAVQEYKAKTLLVGGGVAANPLLRRELEAGSEKLDVSCYQSPVQFTGDNAAMIALAGYYRYQAGERIKPNPKLKTWQKISAQPNLKLV